VRTVNLAQVIPEIEVASAVVYGITQIEGRPGRVGNCAPKRKLRNDAEGITGVAERRDVKYTTFQVICSFLFTEYGLCSQISVDQLRLERGILIFDSLSLCRSEPGNHRPYDGRLTTN
jgi:hypothetical protein